ncbi:MAG: hypothetical protein QM756_25245 [Polyangiaceae bacterium]
MPVAAYAERERTGINLRGLLAEPDGSRLRRAETWGSFPESDAEAEQLGSEFGRELRDLPK